MAAYYVLADGGIPELSSPVFGAGSGGGEEAVAVFTSKAAAEKYITASGWEGSEVTAELQPVPLLRWLLNLDAEGVEYLAVDPDRESHKKGEKQSVLGIDELTDELSEHLCTRLQASSH